MRLQLNHITLDFFLDGNIVRVLREGKAVFAMVDVDIAQAIDLFRINFGLVQAHYAPAKKPAPVYERILTTSAWNLSS